MNKTTKLLITGANGQLGRELVSRFDNDIRVDLLALGREELDLGQEQEIQTVLGEKNPDIVVNCGAYTKVDLAESEIDQAYAINAEGPRVFGELAEQLGFWVIHISTDYVFDGTNNEPHSEEFETNPQSVYGKSKLEGEKNLLNACLSACVIRTSWLYSAYGNNFVKTMLRVGRAKKAIQVVNDQVSSPTYASDLADAIKEIIDLKVEGKSTPKGIFHFSNSGETSWYEFALEIMGYEQLGCRVEATSTAEFGAAAPRPAYSKLDCTKLKKSYNIEGRHWKDALYDCLDTIKEIEEQNAN